MAFIKCPKCGQTALSVATVCPKCGHILLQSPTPQGDSRDFANCRRCGKIIARTAAVCEFCGYPQRSRRRLRRLAWTIAAAAVVLASVLGALRLFPSGIRSPAVIEHAGGIPVQPEATTQRAPVAVDSAPAADTAPPVAAPIVAAAPSAAAVPAPTVEPPPQRVTTSTLNRWALTWANIRSGPGSDYPVLRVLRPGERVQVADASRGWWTVYEEGTPAGYIANSVLSDRSLPPDSLRAR